MKERVKKILEIVEKHSVIALIIIFLIGILLYGFIASRMNNPVFLDADEELYINMARSIFFEGNISRHYGLLDFKCILYSCILSLAYFFYSPENIIFIMRMIGVFLMISSVFPIYLLSKEVLKSKIKALGLTLASLLVPELIYTSFMLQEVLLYPVFMWTLYLIYLNFSKGSTKFRTAILTLLLASFYFIKSYAIVFTAAYYGTMILLCLKDKEYKKLINIIIQGVICLGIIVLGMIFVSSLNGFEKGSNHYIGQIASVFPIDAKKIKYFVYGIFYYIVILLFYTGLLPILIPIFNIKKYEKADRKFILYLILSLIFTIIEIVFIIFLVEELGHKHPDRFHMRYFAVFSVPFLIMFFKCKKEDIKINLGIIISYVVVFGYLIWFFAAGRIHGSLIDSGMLYTIERQNICLTMFSGWQSFNSAVIAVFAIVAGVMITLCKTNEKALANIKKMFAVLGIGFGVVILYYNAYWHVMDVTAATNDQEAEDLINFAYTVNNDYDLVLALKTQRFPNNKARVFYANTTRDYMLIDENEEIDISGKKVILILSKYYEGEVIGADEIDIGTKEMKIYASDKKYVTLQVNKLEEI